MEIKIINHTPNPEKIIIFAARTCYTDLPLKELEKKIENEDVRGLLKDLIISGHHSPLEHASFTFSVEGVSRILLAQLTRHRIASYSVQSQRYVSFKEIDFVIPPKVENKPEMKWIFTQLVDMAKRYYDELRKHDIPSEDARYILPQCVTTKIVFTMNARELLHFFRLRLCNRAQWEIRETAQRMLEEVLKVAPNVFHYAGPNCRIDVCKEKKPCGRPYPKLIM